MHGPHADELPVGGALAGDKAVDALHLARRGGSGEHDGAGDPRLGVLTEKILRRAETVRQIRRSQKLLVLRPGVEFSRGLNGRRGDLFRKYVSVGVYDLHSAPRNG